MVDCVSKRIGNHIYKKRVEGGIAYLLKGCSRDNNMVGQCGQWTIAEFLAHATPFDNNTETHYDEIKRTVVEALCMCGHSKTMPYCDGLHSEN